MTCSSTSRDWLEKCLLFPELIGFPIHWHAVKPGRPFKHGPFVLTAFAHRPTSAASPTFSRSPIPDTCFDCYGAIIEYDGKRYVYSADLAHPQELTPALKEGKVAGLMCELTHFPERELFSFVSKIPGPVDLHHALTPITLSAARKS